MDIITKKAEIRDIPDIIKMNDEFNGVGATAQKFYESCGYNRDEEIMYCKILTEEKRFTLEKIFEDWNGTPYDSYDWGELDKPIGKELI